MKLHVLALFLSFLFSLVVAHPRRHIHPRLIHRRADNSDLSTMTTQRLSRIVGQDTYPPSQISAFISDQTKEGNWQDVDYTQGCSARRANWPAQEHWRRIVAIAGAYHGGVPDADYLVDNADAKNAISNGMDWWFHRDFTNSKCLDSGGTNKCPCGTPGLWNTNWFSNIILIPTLSAKACLLIGSNALTSSQLSGCKKMASRSYGTFSKSIHGVGALTGANTLDVASIGIDLALLNGDTFLLTDAYNHVHSELAVNVAVKGDGIRPDGSFGQHTGLLYNGNYGKDYTKDLLDLETQAGGTAFTAATESRSAFETLFDGDEWMIYCNTKTEVLHWDFSSLGRFITFPVADAQATGSIHINLTEVSELGNQWNSDVLTNFADSLSASSSSANAGNVLGNRMFYANDYMVQRGENYVSSVKMFSSRTKNTECVNSQNPFGFHLSDGTMYTYVNGDEYEDISAVWDWNLIPGTTVDYDATSLSCDHAQFTGIESFVGGVSDGQIGISVMRYTNPYTKSLSWKKSWFFLSNDIQRVMISDISSSTQAPVYSVLDQKRHSGAIFVNQDNVDSSQASRNDVENLWHDNIGYVFDNPTSTSFSLQVGQQGGDWSTIGASTQPPLTVDLFAAWIHHDILSTPVSYTVFPGTTFSEFGDKMSRTAVTTIQNDAHISAVLDQDCNKGLVVFWDSIGGTVDFGDYTVSVSQAIAIIFDISSLLLTVSDPSQTLNSVTVTVKGPNYSQANVAFNLPTGGLAGSSVSKKVQIS